MSRTTAPRIIVECSSDADGQRGSGPDLLAPAEDVMRDWVIRALSAPQVLALDSPLSDPSVTQCGVSLHLAGSASSQALNLQYRGADTPTNVLSFPAGLPPLDGVLTLGELVLCPEVVQAEAAEQGKEATHHWAHMLVHGSLHLLGYDHIDDDSAVLMESLEIRLLSDAGISDPYRGTTREFDG